MAANGVEVPKMKLGGKRFPGVVAPIEQALRTSSAEAMHRAFTGAVPGLAGGRKNGARMV